MLAIKCWRERLRDRAWKRALLAGVSGVVFSLAFLLPSLFVWCWCGLIPLLWSLNRVSVRQAYVLGLLTGVAFYACGTYWIGEFISTVKGYTGLPKAALSLLFWFYSAQAWALIATLFVWLRRANLVHEAWLFALVFVSVCVVFPTLFAVRPGESQSQFIASLQAVEFTGVYGLDFLIVLVNGALYCLLGRQDMRPKPLISSVLVVLAWLGYGAQAQQSWRARIGSAGTLRVGWVQPNEPPSTSVPEPLSGYTRAYPPAMALTERLAAGGAQVVIWPETRFKGWFAHDYVRQSFQHQFANLELPVIFQDTELITADGLRQEYNSAVHLDRHGQLAGKYRKIQRIPFGEYLPLVTDVRVLNAWVSAYLGGFFSPISRGAGPQVFQEAGWAMVPMICYEAMFPALVAESVSESPQGKMLLALSNDSWFGATRQPYIHLRSSVLRAVENRLPLLHVLNNGPSAYITPDGRILFQSEFGATAGYLIDAPYSTSEGGSLFSRYPYWFTGLLHLALVSLIARTAWLQRRRRSRQCESGM